MDNDFVHHARHANTNHETNNRSLWDRFWRDKKGRIIIGQVPNVWLILWLIFEVVSLLVSSHSIEIVSWWIATGALLIWSLLEIFKGANYFRRLLGLCIAVLTIVTVLGIGL